MYTLPTKGKEARERIDDNTRKEDILNFLKFHQGCSKEDVVRGVNNIMSKKTVYRILDELIQYNIVSKEREKPNSKNYRLFLNSKNNLLIITDELKEFEKYYFQLLKKIVKCNRYEKFKKLKEVRLDYYEFITETLYAITSIILPLKIIDFVLHTYMNKCFFILPYIISNEKLLRKINLTIFSKISEIFNHSLNIIPIKKFPNNLELSTTIIEKNIVFDKYTLGSITELIANIEYYRLFDSEKEYQYLLDILWNIHAEILKIVFKEKTIVMTVNRLLKEGLSKQQSQIDTNKDNWRKLISDKIIDPKDFFYSKILVEYVTMKKDSGISYGEGRKLAEEMINELEKLA